MDNPIVALALLGGAAGALIGALLKQIRDDTRQLVDLNFGPDAVADDPGVLDDYETRKAQAAARKAAKPATRKPKPATP